MKNKSFVILLLILSIPPFGCSDSSTSTTRSSGSLDTNFGVSGKVTTSIGSRVDAIRAIAIQTDGSIVALGSSLTGTNVDVFALVRYKPDGSLDTTFNTTGTVTTAIGSIDDIPMTVDIQSDGKIVAAGHTTPGGFGLARYNSDGTLDTSFGTGGKVTTAIGNGSYAATVAFQTDNKIVVAGSALTGGSNDFALVRYNSDGSLDTGFGTGGIVTTSTGTSVYALHVYIQTDGKILTVGVSSTSASISALVLARYNSDGSLDTTFGSDGIVTAASVTMGINNVALQTDGKIVTVGYSFPGFGLGRYNSDGTFDTTFGTGGIVNSSGINGIPWDVAIQDDGKIVAAGYSFVGSDSAPVFALSRYNTNGSLDTSFNSTGIVTTAIGTMNDSANAVAICPNGMILAAGSSRTSSTTSVFTLVRYLP
jgi:uncharacterized delta-60 repeat protein